MNNDQNQNLNAPVGTPAQTPPEVVIPPVAPVAAAPVIEPPKKKKRGGVIFLLFVIVALAGYLYYSQMMYQKNIQQVKDSCSPVSTAKGEKELGLDSTVVADLYNKVSTDIREDLASTTIDDSMKLYLASRQISKNDIYDSNCNLFSNTSMNPYTCENNIGFSPTAFKEEILILELKKLFGEEIKIENANVQLGSSCIGGYQYIKERGEYVEGYCAKEPATVFRVEKELVKATSRESTITLTEKVTYYGSEGLTVPENLQNGTYSYTFRLDPNYNYIYIGKSIVES